MSKTALTHWVLTLVCKDRPGIVHAISGAIVKASGNITESHQFTSEDTGRFFMRLQFESPVQRAELEQKIAQVTKEFGMDWELDVVGRKMKTLVLVSKAAHCLNDLLFRQRSGQLPILIPKVLANHDSLGELATFYGIDFESQAINSPEDKLAFEAGLRELIRSEEIELIVVTLYIILLFSC
jgi:formyltetrahydrofolate deformylase